MPVEAVAVARRSTPSYAARVGSRSAETGFPPPRVALRRLTVAQYRAMARAGILKPDDRIELLDGFLVEKMTKNPPHRIATGAAREALARVVPDGWYVDAQEPIVTADSEPEPDVSVVRGRSRDYTDTNPPAERVGLVVEIADASLVTDRVLKGSIYARAAIPAYWIVNLADRIVEVYSRPSGAGASAAYTSRVDHAAGSRVALALDDVECTAIAVEDLLP